MLEVFLDKKISVQTGLLFGTPEEKKLPFPLDYNRATGRWFEDDYRKYILHHDRLPDTVVRTSVMRRPIVIQYYLPAKGNVSFPAMAGTKLNVSVYQTVAFRSFYAGEQQLNKFETRPQYQHLRDTCGAKT